MTGFEVGNTFTVTYEVSEAVYRGFLAAFRDHNPLHTDASFARAKGFAGEVMHGNILNGFLSHFVGECLPTKDVIIHAQDIKFLKPVYLHDTLTLRAEVTELSESVNAVILKFAFRKADQLKVASGTIQVGVLH